MEQVIFRNLVSVGEKCVNEARLSGNYTDRTGNLRSSVGYVLTHNGEIVYTSSFPTIKGGNEGATEGRDYALELAKTISGDWVLIVVAGRQYAAYVRARGYDVIDKAEDLARKLLKQLADNGI